MKFELTEVAGRLVNVNPRPELHGEDKKPAADLKIAVKQPSNALIQLHPNLRAMLYEKSTTPDLADQGTDDPTALRFPQIDMPLKWSGEQVGGKVTVHRGISAKSDLVLEGVVVNEFRVSAMEGGTVEIGFRVQFHPDEKTIGRLCMLTGQESQVSVEPPEETQEGLGGDEE